MPFEVKLTIFIVLAVFVAGLLGIWFFYTPLRKRKFRRAPKEAFYKTVMSFVREWMVKGLVPRHQAFRNVAAVEDAFRQSERYLPDEAVLCLMTDRLVWPKGESGE